MKLSMIRLAVTGAATVMLAGPAMAADWYVFGNTGVGVSDATESYSVRTSNSSWSGTSSATGAAFAGDLGMGLRISPYLAAELSYGRLGNNNFNMDVSTSNPDRIIYSRSFEVKRNGFRLALMGIYPFGERFEVFGTLALHQIQSKWRVSVSDGEASGSRSKTALGVGTGLTFKITPKLHVRGQYEYVAASFKPLPYTDLKAGDVHLFKAGLVYAF